jgi:hypothetical protein
MKKGTVGALALLASMALTACGEDPLSVNSGDISQAEAAAIAEFLLSSTYQNAFSTVQTSPEGPQLVPFSFETRADLDAPCPLGGSVAISATVSISGDTELEGGSISMSMTQVHSACAAQQEDTGIQFTLNGNPNIVAAFDASSDAAGQMSVSGSLDGALGWETAEGSGNCVIALSYTASGNENAGAINASVSGSVCGLSVSQDMQVG